MELQSSKDDENEKALEALGVENNKEDKEDRNVATHTENNQNEVTEISVGEKEEKALEAVVEENDMASKEAESLAKKMPRVTPSKKTKIVKTRVKRLVKRKRVEVMPSVHGMDVTKQHGTAEGTDLDLAAVNKEEGEKGAGALLVGNDEEVKKVIEGSAEASQLCAGDEKDAEPSLWGNVMDVVKVIESSAEAPRPSAEDEKAAEAESTEKKNPKGSTTNPKIMKTRLKRLQKGKNTQDTRQVQKNDKGENNNSLDGSEQGNGIEKLSSPEINIGERGQKKSVVEKNKQDHSTQDKTDLPEDDEWKNKRQGKRVLGVNKKPKHEPASTNVEQQGIQGGKETPVVPEKKETSGNKKAKLGGLIFMCNAKTKPDCFRFRVMGVSGKKKDFVMGIKPGLKLFLYDYDLKLLYGIFQASSVGGMKLEPNAFGGTFPAQVRFKVIKECEPLPESLFRKAIKENYNNKNKFKTELTPKQVFKLRKLFRPAAVPSTTQLTHSRPIPVARNADRQTTQLTHPRPIPVSRDPNRQRSDRDRYASGSSRTHSTHRHEGGHDRLVSPPRREEPCDLYLSEREYRTYGLRRAQTSQHYPIPPPADSYHAVDRDRVALDSYHPDLYRDPLLRHADAERHNHRETLHSEPLYLPERHYHPHDHRRELLAPLPQNPTNPPFSAVAQDSYARDPYYSYDYRAPVLERPSRAYPPSPGRDDALYLRYATADSLAEYYRTRRYPGFSGSELPPSSVTPGYSHTGPSSYPYR